MSDTPKTRAERREEQREMRKDFDAVVKEIKRTLEERSDADFKMAVMTALQRLEVNHHDNNLTAALMIGGCVDCESRGDENAARLLLYVSGAIVDPTLTRFALNTLMNAQQMFTTASAVNSSPTTKE